ncbi:MAG: lysoplasmalogenase [Thermoanaerobaculia bacterium]|nr:lysoplasmalogenase [Thermoanaerobaculia bacterium]
MAWYVIWTAIAVSFLLWGEESERHGVVRFAKPLASAAFVTAAAAAPGAVSVYGALMLGGFVLSFAGDVLLISRERAAFMAGLGAFLMAHLSFAVAFALRGIESVPFLAALAVLFVAATLVWRNLAPRLSRTMFLPVAAYIAAIVLMCAAAAGTLRHGLLVPLGAIAFVLSDLSVARDRFVAPGFVNRAWGLPLYYAAQLLLAASLRHHVP